MKYQENFKFLNLQVIQKKNAEELKEDERSFIKLNLLDNQNNPCAFMIFDKDIMKKLLSNPIPPLSELLVAFELAYSSDKWNVRLVDIVGK